MGAMGGLDPPTSLSQAVFPPPKRVFHGDQLYITFLTPMGTITQGADPKGQPLGGVVSGVILPRMAPLILGLLGSARE